MKKAIKALRNFLFALIALASIAFTAFFLLYRDQIQTISSISKIDDFPVYTMDYKGTYWFDEFLNEGGSAEGNDFSAFFNGKLTHGLIKNIDFSAKESTPMCTCFVCRNEDGDILFCRNMEDNVSRPSVVVTTHSGSFSSVGTARLKGAPDNAPAWYEKISFLSEPYYMGDGMNEAGLAVSILSVPYSNVPEEVEGAPYLNSEQICRLILNEAGSVEEAVLLFDTFNADYSPRNSKRNCHFFLADRFGDCAVVELHDGIVDAVEPVHDNYMTVTNFYLNDMVSSGTGQARYQFIEDYLELKDGILSVDEALLLLSSVKDPYIRPQWSCVYNLTNGEMYIFPNGQIDHIYKINYDFND